MLSAPRWTTAIGVETDIVSVISIHVGLSAISNTLQQDLVRLLMAHTCTFARYPAIYHNGNSCIDMLQCSI